MGNQKGMVFMREKGNLWIKGSNFGTILDVALKNLFPGLFNLTINKES